MSLCVERHEHWKTSKEHKKHENIPEPFLETFLGQELNKLCIISALMVQYGKIVPVHRNILSECQIQKLPGNKSALLF